METGKPERRDLDSGRLVSRMWTKPDSSTTTRKFEYLKSCKLYRVFKK